MFPNVRGYTREVKSVGAFRRENGRTLTSLHALYTNSTPTLQNHNHNQKFNCQCPYDERERGKRKASFDPELYGNSNLGKLQAGLEKGEAGGRFRR